LLNTLKNAYKSDDKKSEVLTIIKPELAKILSKKTELVNITSKNNSYNKMLDLGVFIYIYYEKSLFLTLYKTDRTVL
jgi:hypothetical protein